MCFELVEIVVVYLFNGGCMERFFDSVENMGFFAYNFIFRSDFQRN